MKLQYRLSIIWMGFYPITAYVLCTLFHKTSYITRVRLRKRCKTYGLYRWLQTKKWNMKVCRLSFPGLAQCTELCLQLRGECGKRQVPGAKIGLQHNLGLGGAVVVALYQLGFPHHGRYLILDFSETTSEGYSPGHVCWIACSFTHSQVMLFLCATNNGFS